MTVLDAFINLRDDMKTWVANNLRKKVDKVDGKSLSTNDYTNDEKTKLSNVVSLVGDKSLMPHNDKSVTYNVQQLNNKIDDQNNSITEIKSDINRIENNTSNSIQNELSNKVTNSFTADRVLISNSSGKVAASEVTSTELGYLDGVISPIQTQLNTVTNNITNIQNQNSTASTNITNINTKLKDAFTLSGNILTINLDKLKS